MKWFVKCIRNYANFTGRARRKEYWNFVLFAAILSILANVMDRLIFGQMSIGWFAFMLSLFLFLPQLSVSVRRLHDTGKSGYHLLGYILANIGFFILFFILLVVICAGAGIGAVAMSESDILTCLSTNIGFLITVCVGYFILLVWSVFFLVWFLTKGDKGENKYGPDPKEVEV